MPRRKPAKTEVSSPQVENSNGSSSTPPALSPLSMESTNLALIIEADIKTEATGASAQREDEAISISESESVISIDDREKVWEFDDNENVKELTHFVRSPQSVIYSRQKSFSEDVVNKAAYGMQKTREVLEPIIATGATAAAQNIGIGIEKALPAIKQGASVVAENLVLLASASIDAALPLIAKGAQNLSAAAVAVRDEALRAAVQRGEIAKLKLKELERHGQLAEQTPAARPS